MAPRKSAKKHAGGRPRKLPADRRVRFVQLRLTQEEWDRLEEAAGGFPPGTWARVELMRLVDEHLEEEEVQ